MASKGYSNGIFNMLFLLQMKIIKTIKGQQMDEALFSSYFKKLYKSLRYMEADFLKLLQTEERESFLIFTKSLKDLATHFKCAREHKEQDEYAEIRLSKKKITDITTKMIFGIGSGTK